MRPFALMTRLTWLALYGLSIVACAVVLFRIVVPYAIDAHDDVLALMGAAAVAGGLVLMGWLIFGFVLLASRLFNNTSEDSQ